MEAFLNPESNIPFYAMGGVFVLAAGFFILVLASLIYHWHYEGITTSLRWVLLTIFTSAGVILLLSAGGLLIKFL